jgi:nitrite reductase (NO-forming)
MRYALSRAVSTLASLGLGVLFTALGSPGAIAATGDGPPAPIVLAQAGAPVPATSASGQPQTTQATPDLEKAIAAGRVAYRNCQACHSLDPGRTLIGPSLAGIFGRHSGSIPNFNYSPAMRKADIVWDDKTLDEYLAAPQKVVPGNRMPFPGLRSATDRYDVIAYLHSRNGQPEGTAVGGTAPAATAAAAAPAAAPAAPVPTAPAQAGVTAGGTALSSMLPELHYTLRSGIADGRMVFIGVGGVIDGQINPTLSAAVGESVQITLLNGEGAEHDIVFPTQNARSARVTGRGSSTTMAFTATALGDFLYYCDLPGHREAGMEGRFTVTREPPVPALTQADISHDPANVPPAIGNRAPHLVRVDLEAIEQHARLADGTSFTFWTFGGTVPGPFVRVRVGDTVEVHMKNAANSAMMHSVDFHAATGPGGGSAGLQAAPGEEKVLTFKALVPGLFVYHCATPMVSEHIANGMYGLILVEPEGGLPHVDHEFYVMQGEVYTEGAYGQQGSQQFSVEKLLDERPEYIVFNGSVGALSKLHPLHAKVGESVRIYFGDGGPNFTSSFHVIGEIFENVYQGGSLENPPIHGVQTVSVPPGGSTVVEFKPEVPGQYVLVDHALARMERGLVGLLQVDGQANPATFHEGAAAGK